MPLTIISGGQYGGEGKGSLTAYLSRHDKIDLLVKAGGPNSSHTFSVNQQFFRVRMVPSGTNLGPTGVVFPPGCLIHVDCLFAELETLRFSGDIFVDPKAGIVDQGLVERQRQDTYYAEVGST